MVEEMRRQLIKDLEKFIPFNEQEVRDKDLILDLLKEETIFFRSHLAAHMTASAWVVNQNRDKVLMAYHNLYDSWSWLGGHADGDEDLLRVAIREVCEESSLSKVEPILSDIFSVEVLTVDGHEKKGAYVPSHLHLNITYLLAADEKERLSIKEDENSQIGWFLLTEAVQASNERWFQEHIYSKLNKKLMKLKNDQSI